ncbi:peroxisome assembly protein 12-A-like [Lytechinus pictus]|uniref:peroxisome assembly protein 12-A-like n=1 Tax=Lytechinus pictus TaxID=7653 RepID=UPI0030B9E460
MAEFGAHLTSATTDNRPSFFEVLAQESLMVTLRPALSYFLKVLAENHPAQFGRLHRWSDEVYSTLDLILQHHFLTNTSASFAENFYSLKRVPLSSTSVTSTISQGLPKKEHLLSLALLVVIPYIKLKLDAKFHKWTDESLDASDRGRQSIKRYKKIFLAVYPYLHLSWESSILVYQLRYLFRQSHVHSPFLKLAGVKLQYLSREDMLLSSDSSDAILSADLSLKSRLLYYMKRLVGGVAIAISNGLSVGVFFLQFLEWWYMSEDHQSALAATSLPIPEPPKEREPEYCQILLPRDVTLCPLCQKKRTNDTTLLTSGYVFCYPCIYTYIKKHQRCPVTRYPSELCHLIKLYPPDS